MKVWLLVYQIPLRFNPSFKRWPPIHLKVRWWQCHKSCCKITSETFSKQITRWPSDCHVLHLLGPNDIKTFLRHTPSIIYLFGGGYLDPFKLKKCYLRLRHMLLFSFPKQIITFVLITICIIWLTVKCVSYTLSVVPLARR